MKQIVNKLLYSKRTLSMFVGFLTLIIAITVIINICFVTLPIIKVIDDSEYTYSSSEKKAIINYVTAVSDYYNGIVIGKYDIAESSDRLKKASDIIDRYIDSTSSKYLLQTCYADILLCKTTIEIAQLDYKEAEIDSLKFDEKTGKLKTKKIPKKELRKIKHKIKYAAKLSVKAALKYR